MQIGNDGHEVISSEPLLRVEEQATVKVVARLTGRVEVSTRTDTIEELVTQELTSTKVDVTRHPRDELIALDGPVPQTRTENGVTIVPVLEERLVVEKRLYLVEEIHIRQTEDQQVVTLPITLRKGRVDITRTAPEADEP
ncbi:MAG: DUF2382 domain-containing protein [Pseudorhodobacter sp.]|nr:DUF2382 domain-containing protein [Pseudorhodobacter sp.]